MQHDDEDHAPDELENTETQAAAAADAVAPSCHRCNNDLGGDGGCASCTAAGYAPARGHGFALSSERQRPPGETRSPEEPGRRGKRLQREEDHKSRVSESESDSESLGNDNPLAKPESGWHSLNVEQLKTLIHRMGFSLPAKCNKTTMATKLDQILTIQEAHNKAAREAGWEARTPVSEAANKKRRISKLCNPDNPYGIIGSEKFPLADRFAVADSQAASPPLSAG